MTVHSSELAVSAKTWLVAVFSHHQKAGRFEQVLRTGPLLNSFVLVRFAAQPLPTDVDVSFTSCGDPTQLPVYIPALRQILCAFSRSWTFRSSSALSLRVKSDSPARIFNFSSSILMISLTLSTSLRPSKRHPSMERTVTLSMNVRIAP